MLYYKFIQPDEISTSVWSGGTTTQLAIYPETEAYADRNFIWRLSSATVDEEKSTFTRLPDYHRFILMQEGTVTLTHKGGPEIVLPPWKVHEFDGGDETLSVGRATDFNLMLRKGRAEGKVEVLSLKAGEAVEIHALGAMEDSPKDGNTGFLALYCSQGSLEISFAEGEGILGAGGLFLAESLDDLLSARNLTSQTITLITCRINTK